MIKTLLTKKMYVKNIFLLFLTFTQFTWLKAQYSEGGSPLSMESKNATTPLLAPLETVPTLTMKKVDVARLVAEDEVNDQLKEVPWRFGENLETAINPSQSGVWETLADGTRIWRVAIYSKNAYHINLTFNRYRLPVGAKLFVFNEDFTHVIGAFTHKNNQEDGLFATTLVKGERIYVEYSEPANATFRGELAIDRVTHGYRDAYNVVQKTMDGFGQSGACNNNVNCPTAADWACVKRSVVMLVTNGNGFCTGTLMNNTRQDRTPYVLTANHCYSNPSTWVFWFNWEASGCTNPASSPAYQSLSGATLRARRTNTDFCLVQINSAVPQNYNASFSGWDRSGVAPTSGASIHHPSGDIKKISFISTPFVSATYSPITNNNAWQTNWSSGVTEPGSSGSAVFDQNKRLVGQLYGGPSSCTATSKWDYYGKISASWEGTAASARLKDWLAPIDTNFNTIDVLGCSVVPAITTDIPTTAGTYTADSSSVDANGWTNFFKKAATAPNTGQHILVLSVKLPSGVTVNPSQVSATVNSTTAVTPSLTYKYMSLPNTWFEANRFWKVTGNAPTGNYRVRFYYASDDFLSIRSNIITFHDSLEAFRLAPSVDPNPLVRTGVSVGRFFPYATTYSPMQFGTVQRHYLEFAPDELVGGGGFGAANTGGQGALMADLVSFTAVRQGNANVLRWRTEGELRNDYFYVEHSLDGLNYKQIAQINANGTTTTPKDYSFEDNKSFAKRHFYRIRYRTLKGYTMYSMPVELVIPDGAQANYRVYPNPTNNVVNLGVLAQNEMVEVQVYNAVGQLLLTKSFNANTSTEIMMRDFADGVYFLKIRSNTLDEIVRVLKTSK